jgi:hypothetical protein
MELPYLPLEIRNYIIYNCGGLISPTAIIMKKFIKDNEFYKSEIFQEPNFYDYLIMCKILKRNYPNIFSITSYELIYDSDFDVYYALGDDDYFSDSDLDIGSIDELDVIFDVPV